ncbi:DUF488 domain-containing protein [Pseudomonas sp. NY15435]|uniref:DUF488 domain-containing protein n=1 Tax=Pseudomonas sp. NY15435 TaxID=3400358 RepID=UPI003A865D2C
MIRCKRAYEPATKADGQRVLVDRLWPRGIRKEDLYMEYWAKDASPSNELRQRFHHDPSLFEDFRKAYHGELNAHPEHWMGLLDLARKGTLTLLYAARDEEHNNARVLAEFLEDELQKQGEGSSPVCYAGKAE